MKEACENMSAPKTHLSTAECWELLEHEKVGRLALTGSDGAPDIFPVNYVAYQGAVYIRSAPDIKDVLLTAHHQAAFEVDGHDDEGWWSVVLRGTASRLSDLPEIERSGVNRLVTASPRNKAHVLKLSPRTVTGRHFRDEDQRPDPPSRQRHTPQPTPQSQPDPVPPRQKRPTAVHSRPPLQPPS